MAEVWQPWQTIREHEKDFDKRGIGYNSYVATNSLVVAVDESGEDAFSFPRPSLRPALGDMVAEGLVGTALIALYNNDNVVPVLGAQPNVVYGDVPHNRPLFIDEVFVSALLHEDCNFSEFSLITYFGWLDQGAMNGGVLLPGATQLYAMANLNVDEQVGAFAAAIRAWRTAWNPMRLYNAGVGGDEQDGIVPLGHGPNTLVSVATAVGQMIESPIIRFATPLMTSTRENFSWKYGKSDFIVDPGQGIVLLGHSLVPHIPAGASVLTDLGNTAQLIVDAPPAPAAILGEVITGITSGASMTVTQLVSTTQFVGTMASGADFLASEPLVFSGGAGGISSISFRRLLSTTPVAVTGTVDISCAIKFRQPLLSEPWDWDKESVEDTWPAP